MPKKLYFKRISYYVNQLLKINYTRIQAYFPEFPSLMAKTHFLADINMQK
ncbi:hypothetical protein Q4502_03795 [Mesomycoplasma ovipneumoniae]|nr:hypothetical protein [Mesomycoplasma ovipneumoniae]MDO6856818.1 hypothetical protein [Mesomycoplasma ovipneumoniae]